VGFVLSRDVLKADQGTPKMQEIARAIQEGSKRLTAMNVVDTSVPYQPHRSTRHLRVP